MVFYLGTIIICQLKGVYMYLTCPAMVRIWLPEGGPTCSICGAWTAGSWSECCRCRPWSERSDNCTSCRTALMAAPARYTRLHTKSVLKQNRSRNSSKCFPQYMESSEVLSTRLIQIPGRVWVFWVSFRTDSGRAQSGRSDALHQHPHM